MAYPRIFETLNAEFQIRKAFFVDERIQKVPHQKHNP